MSKTLLIFLHSKNPELYINILTHCIENEDVKAFYFAGAKESPGRQAETSKKIAAIRAKLEELVQSHPEYPPYKRTLDIFPAVSVIDNYIFRVDFDKPEDSIQQIKKRFNDLNNLLIDVTGCEKRSSMHVVSAFISNNIKHVCCIELTDDVYLDSWGNKPRLYHNLKSNGISYYSYEDFSKDGTTIRSFDKMRQQGRFIRMLLFISIFLSAITILVSTALAQQQTWLTVIFIVFANIPIILGLFNDVFDFDKNIKGNNR